MKKKVIHTIDSLNIGGIQEMMLNLHKYSIHEHVAWGHRGTMAPYMDAAGMRIFEGGPPADEVFDIVVGHGVGGWSHKDTFSWAHERGMATVECLHSNHLSPTPPEDMDAFVGLSMLACESNTHLLQKLNILHAVYVPVDVSRFQASGERTKIGKLCRLVAEKSPLEFVEIARAFPNDQFVLAGDGPLMGQIQAMRPPNLELLGMIRDFPAFYATLKLFLYPTKDECMSASVAMAQSAGVLVICQDIPALRESTGGYAQFANSIDEFCEKTRWNLDNPNYRNDDVEMAQEWAWGHFDVPVTIGVWDKIINQLAG